MECRATARLWNEAATGRILWNVATWDDGGNSNASALEGLNVSAPAMRQHANVDAGMAYDSVGGGPTADAGMAYDSVGGGPTAEKSHSEECDTSSSEWSNALCEGLRTEVERVFSNDVVIDKKFDLSTEVSYHTDHACDINPPVLTLSPRSARPSRSRRLRLHSSMPTTGCCSSSRT